MTGDADSSGNFGNAIARAICLAMLFFLAGCGGEKKPSVRAFEVRGVVQDVRQDGKVLIIDHEEIPGYMEAMIMPFGVAESEPAHDLQPGDEILFSYKVEEIDSWIEEIRKTGVTKAVKVRDVEDLPAPEGAKILTIGDELPDYKFVDQDGEKSQPPRLPGDARGPDICIFPMPGPRILPGDDAKFQRGGRSVKLRPGRPEKVEIAQHFF